MSTFTYTLLFAVVAVTAIPDFQYDLEKADEYFQAFIEKYGKEYENEDVRARKFEVFKESLKVYNKINLEELNAKFGIHRHSDLTIEELKKILGGYRRTSGTDCMIRGAPAVTTPEAYDWQLQGKAVTSVKRQGCGDCYAFSATGNVESQYAKKSGVLLDLSVQQIVDCDDTNGGCDGGDSAKVLMKLMNMGGQMSLKDYPYKGRQSNCTFDVSKVQVKVAGCEIYKLKTEDDLVKVLYNQGPLSVAIDCSRILGYQGGIARSCPFYQSNHGVLLVGYGVENNTKFWRFKNSWDTDYGEDGYFRVERGKNSCGIMAYEITSAIIA